ncbi:hypothetical protein [Streptomyces fradiae]|uniref:hypothetical protein n=1 Tax=Streptomyces fradiae TaxID=1906 RepID=UPI0035BE905F
MNTWAQGAALLVTAAGLVAAPAAYRMVGDARRALAVLLDFLTAAGLVRLSGDLSWNGVLTAAAVIALRHLITFGLTPARSGAGSGVRSGVR